MPRAFFFGGSMDGTVMPTQPNKIGLMYAVPVPADPAVPITDPDFGMMRVEYYEPHDAFVPARPFVLHGTLGLGRWIQYDGPEGPLERVEAYILR